MNTQSIIEQFQNSIIQIATGSGTGTGFYIKEYDLIVTNDHVVGDNAEVTIAGKSFDKGCRSAAHSKDDRAQRW